MSIAELQRLIEGPDKSHYQADFGLVKFMRHQYFLEEAESTPMWQTQAVFRSYLDAYFNPSNQTSNTEQPMSTSLSTDMQKQLVKEIMSIEDSTAVLDKEAKAVEKEINKLNEQMAALNEKRRQAANRQIAIDNQLRENQTQRELNFQLITSNIVDPHYIVIPGDRRIVRIPS